MATGFRDPLAPDQKRIFACFARRRTGLSQPRRQARARDLAAAILGAHAARRGRFWAAPRLHSLQSGEARPRRARPGLAIFLISGAGCASAPIRSIGPAIPTIEDAHSAKGDGFRCVQPILRATLTRAAAAAEGAALFPPYACCFPRDLEKAARLRAAFFRGG